MHLHTIGKGIQAAGVREQRSRTRRCSRGSRCGGGPSQGAASRSTPALADRASLARPGAAARLAVAQDANGWQQSNGEVKCQNHERPGISARRRHRARGVRQRSLAGPVRPLSRENRGTAAEAFVLAGADITAVHLANAITAIDNDRPTASPPKATPIRCDFLPTAATTRVGNAPRRSTGSRACYRECWQPPTTQVRLDWPWCRTRD